MDDATEDVYLQKLEEFIWDEQKVVTFKWLSATLEINANTARALLQRYVEDKKQIGAENFSATYLVAGTLEDGTTNVTVVNDTQLEAKLSSFETVSSQQIYSVQKVKDIDLSVLSLIDAYNVDSPREKPILGSVVSEHCVKRIFKEKKALPPPPAPVNKEKNSFMKNFTAKSPIEPKKETTAPSSKAETNNSNKPETKPKQKGSGLASLFSKMPVKTKAVQDESVEEEPEAKKLKNSEPVKNKECEAKQTKKPDDKKRKKEKSSPVKKEKGSPVKKSKYNSLVDSDSDSENRVDENVIESTPPPKPKKKDKRPKKSNNTNEKDTKKRKRIVQQQDSDSDDMFANDDEEDEETKGKVAALNSDEEDSPVYLSKPLAPKNKKRKLVDKTYTDEDGYILTTKEWAYESASEEEPEAPKPVQEVKKPVLETKKPKEAAKKSSDSQDEGEAKIANGKSKMAKGKKPPPSNQRTLMSFFKKS